MYALAIKLNGSRISLPSNVRLAVIIICCFFYYFEKQEKRKNQNKNIFIAILNMMQQKCIYIEELKHKLNMKYNRSFTYMLFN